jgi:hypothetical protein
MDSTWTFMGDNGTDAIGGAGGGVELYPVTITNNGLIQAGMVVSRTAVMMAQLYVFMATV